MKSILVLISLCSLQAFAAPGKTTIQTTETVDVHDLACVQRATSGIYTDLRATASSIFVFGGANNVIQLKHPEASAEGCDINKLKDIENKARMGFGFLHSVPVTVVQTLGKSQRTASGECVAQLIENVTATLAPGVVVESGIMNDVPATDCQ